MSLPWYTSRDNKGKGFRMVKFVLASNNKKKIAELETLLSSESSKDRGAEVLSLRDIGFTGDIAEDGDSFEENSLIKASVPASMGYIGIADDSGLAVDYLDGAPGIYSARYAGDHGDDGANREKLLHALGGVPEEMRGGKFVCVITVVLPDGCPLVIPQEYRISDPLAKKLGVSPERGAVIRGECHGIITTEEQGDGGFGYDSLFYYPPFGKTFAEIGGKDKNAVSHRGIAMKKLCTLLRELAEQH